MPERSTVSWPSATVVRYVPVATAALADSVPAAAPSRVIVVFVVPDPVGSPDVAVTSYVPLGRSTRKVHEVASRKSRATSSPTAAPRSRETGLEPAAMPKPAAAVYAVASETRVEPAATGLVAVPKSYDQGAGASATAGSAGSATAQAARGATSSASRGRRGCRLVILILRFGIETIY
ncbi:MAG TPA: hypothetical protein DHV14_09885 [Micrococcales bacterium]|nr:hypothetical protein [Micrococcales bacterium]